MIQDPIHLNAAVEAVKAASTALDSVPHLDGAEGHLDTAFQATADSIAAAKEAIEFASNPQGAPVPGVGQNLADQEFVENLGDAPIVRFSFDGGKSSASGEIIPVGNGNPNPGGLNVSGDAFFSGNAFQVDNMILNINVCNNCNAGRDLIQSGNGYVFPIYTQ